MSKEKQNLSEALQELEQIVAHLNRSDLDVEEGLSEFKKGVELIEFCRGQLKKAENEFTTLKARLDTNSFDQEQEELEEAA